MKFFLDFLYSRRRIIAVFLLVGVAFTLLLLLYNVPFSAIMYSIIVCAVITAAAAFGDFWRFRKKCRLLSELQNEVLFTLERLPAACRHLYALTVVLAGMTVFALDHLEQGIRWIGMLYGSTGIWWNGTAAWLCSNYGLLFLLAIFGAAGFGRRLARYPAVWASVFFMSMAYLVDASYNPFLYFRF